MSRYKPYARIRIDARRGSITIPKNFLRDHDLPFGRYTMVATPGSLEIQLKPTDEAPLIMGRGIVHLNTSLDTPMQISLWCRAALASLGISTIGSFRAPLRVEDGALIIDLGVRVDERR